jgi:hypothetical protein
MNQYAFLVDDDLFDRAYRRLREQGIEHWADPQMRRPSETNTEHGDRGVSFKDPAGVTDVTRIGPSSNTTRGHPGHHLVRLGCR